MDREEIVTRYFEAWNNKDTSGVLRMMHPQASYYDAFWQESCSGRHLGKYFSASFEEDLRWYRPHGELIPTPNGVIVRYEAFDSEDALGVTPIYNGAEVFTLSDELIMTVSDYYCDPTVPDLLEVASLAEGQHGRANVIHRGLGARAAGRIKRRLAKIAAGSPVVLDSSITVTKLADHVGCTVMHLFHVLEELMDTTFLDFVNGSRARQASRFMLDNDDSEVRFDRLSERCGFESVKDLNEAFQLTFGMSAHDYMEKFLE